MLRCLLQTDIVPALRRGHGLNQKLPTSLRVSDVDVGDELDVRLAHGRWQVLTPDDHCLGTLKWRKGDQDKITHAPER